MAGLRDLTDTSRDIETKVDLIIRYVQALKGGGTGGGTTTTSSSSRRPELKTESYMPSRGGKLLTPNCVVSTQYYSNARARTLTNAIRAYVLVGQGMTQGLCISW